MISFAVQTEIVRLAVAVEDEIVTRIQLNGKTKRQPSTRFERLVARELKEYGTGQRTRFTFAFRPGGTEFQRAVWRSLCRIPYGATRTYGDIARIVGNPQAARAVGMANHHNPIAIVIPCHRVVAAGGKLGGYGGGLNLKRRLLSLESEEV